MVVGIIFFTASPKPPRNATDYASGAPLSTHLINDLLLERYMQKYERLAAVR